MNQVMHILIASILFFITWHCYLKQQPEMQEAIKQWQDLLLKKLNEIQ